MPPESRGAIIKSIVEAFSKSRDSVKHDLRKAAAFAINELISTTQTSRHLDKTLDRVTISMGQKTDRKQGLLLINSIVEGTAFENCVNRCEVRLASANSLMGRPFLRNDEPELRFAEFPLHHSAYNV
jgi:hypothetical protein